MSSPYQSSDSTTYQFDFSSLSQSGDTPIRLVISGPKHSLPSLLLSSTSLPPLFTPPSPDLRTLLALPSIRKQLLRATLTHCLSLPPSRIAPFLALLRTSYLQLLPPDDRLTLGELLEAI
jgi:hypothetical protein